MATQAVVDLEYGQGNPDPRALALAGDLQTRLPDAQVLLFGSRATGTWRPESDLDLAVIGGDRDAAEEALAQLQDREQDLYADALPWPHIFHFSQAEFRELRMSPPHMAGQVQLYGLKPDGERLPQMPQPQPWHGVRELLITCRQHIDQALRCFGRKDRPVVVLFYTQAALENAVKARLGAAGIAYTRHHVLIELAELLPADSAGWLDGLFSTQDLEDLTNIRDRGLYVEGRELTTAASAETLLRNTQQACGRLAGETLTALAKEPRDVGYADWLAKGLLAGWESLPLDHYSQAATEKRDNVSLMRTLLTGVVAERDIALIADDWTTRGAPTHVPERLKAVLDNPDTWRSLLAAPEVRERDADRSRVWRDQPPPKGW